MINWLMTVQGIVFVVLHVILLKGLAKLASSKKTPWMLWFSGLQRGWRRGALCLLRDCYRDAIALLIDKFPHIDYSTRLKVVCMPTGARRIKLDDLLAC